MKAGCRANLSNWLAVVALVGTYAASLAFAGKSPRRALAARRVRPRSWARWKHILRRTYEEINDDRLLALAAGVVFYALLALFPAITALVSSYALFSKPTTIMGHLAALSSMIPSGAMQIVDEQVTRVIAGSTGKVSLAFVFGLALALWSANAGLKAIIDALNIVYGVKERRSFIKLNLVSLTLTLGAIVGLLLAMAAVVALPIVFTQLRIDGFGNMLMVWLRWPALCLLLLFALAVLYRFGPDLEHPQWHWITPGAVLAALAWLAGSTLLSWYLSHLADYSATYGSLGAGIGLMMWLWLSSIVVLVGAELNSEIDADDGLLEPPEEHIGGDSA